VAFDPSGNTLVSGGADGMVRIWDVQSHREIGSPLTGHVGNVLSVAFNPMGDIIASGGADHTVRLWTNYAIGYYIRQLCGQFDLGRAQRRWTATEPSIRYHRPC
jgi:WD40 repeat protein